MTGTTAPRSRGELEVQIGRALIQFEKEFMGRGPLETKTYLMEDMILVRFKGVLTAAERKLCESQRDRSAYLLKQVRNELLASGRRLLEAVIHDIVGVQVQSVHTDISTKTGERIIVITLQEKLDLDGFERDRPIGNGRATKIGVGEEVVRASPFDPLPGDRRDDRRDDRRRSPMM